MFRGMAEYDLSSIESWGLPQMGRPFHASFTSAAEHLLASMQPKAVNGAILSGEMLAATADALVEQINQGAQLSLSATVDALRHQQATAAVAASRRAFRDALPDCIRMLGEGVQLEQQGVRPPALATVLSPAAIDLRLHNATKAAVAAFMARAPDMGNPARLQPYADQLQTWIQAMQRELRQEHTHRVRLSAVHASREAQQQQQQDIIDEKQDTIDGLMAQQRQYGKLTLHELLGNVAVVALGATAALLPQTFLTRVAPVVRGTPILLSTLGVWRVARQRVGRIAGAALQKVQDFARSAVNSSQDSAASAAAYAAAAAASASGEAVAAALNPIPATI